jgi:hypothetical protein
MPMERSAAWTDTNISKEKTWQTGQLSPIAQLSRVSRYDQLTDWRCVITLWRLLRGLWERLALLPLRCKQERMSAIGYWLARLPLMLVQLALMLG